MKKLLIVTNLVWFSVFVFFACKPATDKALTDYEKSFEEYRKLPFKGVDAKVVKLLMDNYKRRWDKIKIDDKAQEDARWAWFSLNQLKNMIQEMETNVLNGSKLGSPELGIRFYFIEYPDSVAFKSNSYFAKIPATYQKRHSLLLVPTYKNGEKNEDFDFRGGFDANGQPKTFMTSMREKLGGKDGIKKSQGPTVGVSVDAGETSADNRGGMGPPWGNGDNLREYIDN